MIKRQKKKTILPDRILMRTNRSDEDKPLMEFIAENVADLKRNDIKRLLKYGHIQVNSQVVSAFDFPVSPGVEVKINFSRPFVQFHHPRVELVYEDEDIIVINKGYGLLSVGTGAPVGGKPGKPQETAYNILKDYVKRQNPQNKIFVVHRLDRHTSGLMMFAKSVEMQQAMQYNWNNMVLSRKYVALVEGVVELDEGEVRSALKENSAFKVYSDNSGEGKMSVTRYKVLKRFKNTTLMEFELDTGRKNQIRVHTSELGHPIVGDEKYGGHTSRLHRLALHAQTLRFAHPRSRKDMYFVSDIPW